MEDVVDERLRSPAGVDELTPDGGCQVDWRPPEMSLQYGVTGARRRRVEALLEELQQGCRVDLLAGRCRWRRSRPALAGMLPVSSALTSWFSGLVMHSTACIASSTWLE